MTPPHRRRWMREYMANYRRNPENGEELRKAHRFDSFVWRLSKSLSPRYDILMCVQHGPGPLSDDDVGEDNDRYSPVEKREGSVSIECKSEDIVLEDNTSTTELNPFEALPFPSFKLFYLYFKTGGEDIFKVFLYTRYYLNNHPFKVAFGMVWYCR
jgi:hypothetical protein